MNDCVELGCFRGKTGAQAFQLTVRLTQEIRQVVRRDVEGNGGSAHAVLPRRLNQLGGEASLREDDPHRRHRGSARTQVEGERRVSGVAGQSPLTCTNGRFVNLPELRGAGETLAQHVDGASDIVHFEPGNIAADGFSLMIGEEKYVVIRSRDQSLGDRSHPNHSRFFRSPKVGMADPTYQGLAHTPSLTNILVKLQISLPHRLQATPFRISGFSAGSDRRPLPLWSHRLACDRSGCFGELSPSWTPVTMQRLIPVRRVRASQETPASGRRIPPAVRTGADGWFRAGSHSRRLRVPANPCSA